MAFEGIYLRSTFATTEAQNQPDPESGYSLILDWMQPGKLGFRKSTLGDPGAGRPAVNKPQLRKADEHQSLG
jgi:hypothetical protein